MRKLFLLILFIVSCSHADTIHLDNGQVIDGIIIKATAKKVFIQQNKIIKIYPKEHVQSYLFTRADIIVLNDSEKIACKVISEKDDLLYFVKAEGMDSVLSNSVDGIKYNIYDEIVINVLPATGSQFVNEAEIPVYENTFQKGPFFKGTLGVHSIGLKDNTQFDRPDINEDINASLYGFEVGYNLTPVIDVAIGVENFSPLESSSIWRERSNFSYSFYYLNGNYKWLQFSSKWLFFSGTKVGILNTEDYIFYGEEHGGRIVEDDNFCLKLSIGFSLRDEYLLYTIESGYMFTKKQDLNNSIDTNIHRIMNFEGFSINFGIAILPVYFSF